MPDPSLLPLLHLTDTAFPAGGYAHSFGLETYCQDGRVTDADSLAAFLTMQLEGAALRLMRLGQLEGQRVLWHLHPVIARVAAEATARKADDMWSWAPGLEQASIRHAGLEARLFRS